MKTKQKIYYLFICCALALSSCQQDPQSNGSKDKEKDNSKAVAVNFNADSAYAFVQDQVDFGPRVPGTVAHGLTAQYLLNKLKEYCDNAFIQEGSMTSNNIKVPIRNIIGEIKPDAKKRVLLCAHWDTRPQADEDPDEPTTPSDGANDGASGVGVLLEVARQLQLNEPNIGIDIIFFDAEDMGDRMGRSESWCLGSQYWADNPHKKGYYANYGILLDMVGAKNATYAMEGNSIKFARPIVTKVWQTGQRLGFGNHFINYQGGTITDDHFFINRNAGIPTIDIIHFDVKTRSGFGDFWHTHKDNMSSVDKRSLKAVGHTVLQVVMEEK